MYRRLMERKSFKIGFQIGLQIGIMQGKYDVAVKMLDRGMSIPVIVDLTGLAEEVILSLKRQRA